MPHKYRLLLPERSVEIYVNEKRAQANTLNDGIRQRMLQFSARLPCPALTRVSLCHAEISPSRDSRAMPYSINTLYLSPPEPRSPAAMLIFAVDTG